MSNEKYEFTITWSNTTLTLPLLHIRNKRELALLYIATIIRPDMSSVFIYLRQKFTRTVTLIILFLVLVPMIISMALRYLKLFERQIYSIKIDQCSLRFQQLFCIAVEQSTINRLDFQISRLFGAVLQFETMYHHLHLIL